MPNSVLCNKRSPVTDSKVEPDEELVKYLKPYLHKAAVKCLAQMIRSPVVSHSNFEREDD